MNEIFNKMKTKRIELTDNYFLLPDPYNGLILQKEVEKTRKRKDNSEETYTHFQTIYQPTVSKALRRYLELSLSEAKTIKQLTETVERVEATIEKIKEKW